MKLYKYPIGDGAPESPNGVFHEDDFETVAVDWLPTESINNQMKRMITAGLPKYVGIKAFALNVKDDKQFVITNSTEFHGYESGYFNPSKSKTTILAIEKHFLKYGELRYRKLELWKR